MAEVYLINPPIYYEKGSPVVLDVSYPPLGILYLASVLVREGIAVKVIDVGAEKQRLQQTIDLIRRENPGVVGISSMTPTLQGAYVLAKAIKENFGDNVKVVLGGSHISADPKIVERIKYFDFGITGEGEKTFLSLTQSIFGNKAKKKIYKGQPVCKLDEIPWPAREMINLNLYLEKASLIASRGCPFNCYYCSRPAVSKIVRYRHPKDVVDEMEWLYPFCKGVYLFQDDVFTLNREFTTKICLEMLKRKKKFRWEAYTRVDLVDNDLLKLMSEAGCRSLAFGVETGNETLRRNVIGKNFTNWMVEKTIGLCRKYNISPDGFFMFGHPKENKKMVKQTVNFILKNDLNIFGLAIATPFPGSRLWNMAVKAKIVSGSGFIDKFAKGCLGKGYSGVYPLYYPKTLSLDWLYSKRREVIRRHYLKPINLLRRLRQDVFSLKSLKTDVREGLSVLLFGSSSRQPYKVRYKGKA